MVAVNRLTQLLIVCGAVLCVTACNKDNREVAYCLHRYLERDFNSIEAVVYQKNVASNKLDDGRRFAHRPIMDGPEMTQNCNRIGWMVTCFEKVLVTCDNYSDFFRYRDLLRSVALVQQWLCEDVTRRFSLLVSSVSCYKEALLSAQECTEEALPDNMWPQLLRMEIQQRDVCLPLRRQCRCLEESGGLRACAAEAAHLYHNVTRLFLDSWCGAAAATVVPSLSLAALPALVGLWVRLTGL